MYFSRSSLDKGELISLRRMCEGAEKCAFLHLRREELTSNVGGVEMLLRCCCSRGDRPSIRFIIDPLYIHPASPQQYHALPVAIGTHQHWTSWLARAKMKRGSFPRSAWRCHSNLVRRMELPFMVNTWKARMPTSKFSGSSLHASVSIAMTTFNKTMTWSFSAYHMVPFFWNMSILCQQQPDTDWGGLSGKYRNKAVMLDSK